MRSAEAEEESDSDYNDAPARNTSVRKKAFRKNKKGKNARKKAVRKSLTCGSPTGRGDARERAASSHEAVGLPNFESSSRRKKLYKSLAAVLYDTPLPQKEKVALRDSIDNLEYGPRLEIIAITSRESQGSVMVNDNQEVEFDFDDMSTRTLRDIQSHMNQALNRTDGYMNKMPNGDISIIKPSELNAEMALLRKALANTVCKAEKGDQSSDEEMEIVEQYSDKDSAGASGRATGSQSANAAATPHNAAESSESESSSGESSSEYSSADEADANAAESMQQWRECNMAHQRAMQASHATKTKTKTIWYWCTLPTPPLFFFVFNDP